MLLIEYSHISKALWIKGSTSHLLVFLVLKLLLTVIGLDVLILMQPIGYDFSKTSLIFLEVWSVYYLLVVLYVVFCVGFKLVHKS